MNRNILMFVFCAFILKCQSLLLKSETRQRLTIVDTTQFCSVLLSQSQTTPAARETAHHMSRSAARIRHSFCKRRALASFCFFFFPSTLYLVLLAMLTKFSCFLLLQDTLNAQNTNMRIFLFILCALWEKSIRNFRHSRSLLNTQRSKVWQAVRFIFLHLASHCCASCSQHLQCSHFAPPLDSSFASFHQMLYTSTSSPHKEKNISVLCDFVFFHEFTFLFTKTFHHQSFLWLSSVHCVFFSFCCEKLKCHCFHLPQKSFMVKNN